ncbi:glutamate receptor 2 [Artemisia annua]|uniref:Glutamate receptor 2 n=1 Tax=Artemisia annua TaxID=35608 RepID=A0A2U1PFM6_ARTAN|nr:glutamate receptor 2 [Artemisia annua]
MVMRLLLFVGLVHGVFPFVNSRSNIVDIGSIVTPETINGRVSTIAMKAAVDDVNSDPTILQGKELRLNIHEANFTGFFSIIDAAVIRCLMVQKAAKTDRAGMAINGF